MRLEHFWYGLTNGDGYVFKRSPKLPALIKDPSLRYLERLPARKTPTYTWLPAEQAVAISFVEKARDSEGREGVANHTVIVPIKQYIALTTVASIPTFKVPEINILEPLEVNL